MTDNSQLVKEVSDRLRKMADQLDRNSKNAERKAEAKYMRFGAVAIDAMQAKLDQANAALVADEGLCAKLILERDALQARVAELEAGLRRIVDAAFLDFSLAPERSACVIARALTATQPAPGADIGQAVALTYTNWRGETSERTILPFSIWYGSTDWHPEPQWLLKAIDMEKGAERDFALKDFGHPAPLDAERVREDGV